MTGTENSTTNRYRRLKDRLAKFVIVGGGVFVLLTLLLIFCYLIYVTLPVLRSAQLDTQAVQSVTHSVDDVTFNNNSNQLVKVGHTTDRFVQPSETAKGYYNNSLLAASGTDIILQQQQQKWHLLSTSTEFKEAMLTASLAVDVPRQVSSSEVLSANLFDAHLVEKRLGWVISDGQGLSYLQRHVTSGTTMQQDLTIETGIDQVFLNTQLTMLTVRSSQRMLIYHIKTAGLSLLYDIDLSAFLPSKVITVTPLADGNMILVASADGVVSLWSSVALSTRHSFTPIRQWDTQLNVSLLTGSLDGRHFVVADQQGNTQGYYSTNNQLQWQFNSKLATIHGLSLSSSGQQLVLFNDNQIEQTVIDNPHPDVSFNALFNKLWYQGYPSEAYVWQTSSGSDTDANKFSLVPLTIGTIKITLVAILIAIPLAISAAVYTAFFMSAKIRSVIKPSIEMIEALPTVVLGFVAGLWLAPIIEANLLAVLLSMLMLPLALIAAFTFYTSTVTQRFDSDLYNWLPLLLIPLILMVIALSSRFAPMLESALFAGDFLHWLRVEWGIDYQQRNTLVVGTLMGLAIIPTIYTLSEEAIAGVPSHLIQGSLALGATQWQTVTRVVLLTASSGIFAAVMIGFGRAVGETMVVLMATGNTPLADWDLLTGIRTLTANIAIEVPESSVGSSHYRVLFLSALVLLTTTFVLNSLAEVIRQRLRKKYSEL